MVDIHHGKEAEMRKVISEGPFFLVEREGDEEFCNFKGSFGAWVAHELQKDADDRAEAVAAQSDPLKGAA